MVPSLFIAWLCVLWNVSRINGTSIQTQSLNTYINHAESTTSTAIKAPVLVLDVDGTLYDNDCLIESQIASNSHIFASGYGYNKQQADDLYHKYGSTIRGLFELGSPRKTFVDYSNDVFLYLDLKRLRKYSGISVSNSNTGYNTEAIVALESLYHLNVPIVIASNSPLFHIKRVLSRLGLAQLPIIAFLTPDRCSGYTKAEPEFWKPLLKLYPTSNYACTLIDDSRLNCQVARSLGMKSIHVNPSFSLADAITHFYEICPTQIIDSTKNIDRTSSTAEKPNESINGYDDAEEVNKNVFKFTSQNYLLAKNIVDRQSINTNVRVSLINELAQDFFVESKKDHFKQLKAKSSNTSPTTFNRLVVDIGAGLLNMLPNVMEMFTSALQASLNNTSKSNDKNESVDRRQVIKLKYIAFESNSELMPVIKEKMMDNGLYPYTFKAEDEDDTDIAHYGNNGKLHQFYGTINVANQNLTATVLMDIYVVNLDFMGEEALTLVRHFTKSQEMDTNKVNTSTQQQSSQSSMSDSKCIQRVDLVVGCCVADLFPPKQLVSQIIEMRGNDDGGLLYLPITFTGTTSLIRNKRNITNINKSNSKLNDDSENNQLLDKQIFDLYQAHLVARGHHTDTRTLIHTLQNYGCAILKPVSTVTNSDSNRNIVVESYLEQSCSDWMISSHSNTYMWQCMMKFISTGVLFQYLLSTPSTTIIEKRLEFQHIIRWFQTLNKAAHFSTKANVNINDNNDNSSDSVSDVDDEFVLIAKNIDILVRLPTVNKNILYRSKSNDNPTDEKRSGGDCNSHVNASYFVDDESFDVTSPPPPYSCSSHVSPAMVLGSLQKASSCCSSSDQKVSVLSSCSSSLSVGISFRSLLTNHAAVSDSKSLLSSSSFVLPKVKHMVEFYAPRQVRVVTEPLESPLPFTSSSNNKSTVNDGTSAPLQLLIRSEYSLISTGTELKIFTGDIDSNQPTDLTIQSMEQSLGYPLKFGYSLVGEVIATNCQKGGSDSSTINKKNIENEWLGQRVFSFSPHGTHHWVNADSVQAVPHDIASEDAIFLPSVETAVSLVQKARPMLGERIAIIGAGLIGLLTAMVLSISMGLSSSSFESSTFLNTMFGSNSLCIVDIKPERLAVAAALIPGMLLYNPSTKKLFQNEKEVAIDTNGKDENNNPLLFDKVIELSGNMAGLQTALSITRDFGTIVLGSLYGEKAAPLVLGMKFHRSHIQLVSSQVSIIPEECSSRWSKSRRFALTWHTLRQLKPSRILTAKDNAESCLGSNTTTSRLQSKSASNGLYSNSAQKTDDSASFSNYTSNTSNINELSNKVQQVYDRLSVGSDLTNFFIY